MHEGERPASDRSKSLPEPLAGADADNMPKPCDGLDAL